MTSDDRRVMSGFPSLDKITGGFRPGSLNVISGRPGSGKTSLALNIAYNAATKYNKRVIFYSLEESKISIANKVLLLSPEDSMDIAKSQYPLYVDDRIGSFEEVQVNLREDIEKVHPDLIIIDYLELLAPVGESRESGIAMVTSFLMRVATDYEVPVLVLKQLNRKFISDKGTLRGLEECKCSPVVQDAAVIVFLRWENYGSHMEEPVLDVHLDIAKNRFGERDVTATIKWERAKFKFYEEE